MLPPVQDEVLLGIPVQAVAEDATFLFDLAGHVGEPPGGAEPLPGRIHAGPYPASAPGAARREWKRASAAGGASSIAAGMAATVLWEVLKKPAGIPTVYPALGISLFCFRFSKNLLYISFLIPRSTSTFTPVYIKLYQLQTHVNTSRL